MKTKSLWGSPPGRFYNFLRRVEGAVGERPIQIGILGCADGKFVLPCARKGYQVLAIDTDHVALFGDSTDGHKGAGEREGLIHRLKKERLERYVSIFCDDFVHFSPSKRCHAVYTSGAINYSYDTRYSVSDMINKISTFVDDGGLIYFDYMLPLSGQMKKQRYYFKKGELRSYFQTPDWKLLYDRVLPPRLEKAHFGSPVDHYHHWGYLCVQKQTNRGT
ncbi:hypothetical protein KAR91_04500 [Candidatus Pacearchaeota archaeon]|nr:hypothetical protein [Candidatus Pacearchaeota archaeon]